MSEFLNLFNFLFFTKGKWRKKWCTFTNVNLKLRILLFKEPERGRHMEVRM